MNGKKDRRVHADDLEKNGHHMPRGLGERWIVVVRQKDRQTSSYSYI